MGFNDFINFIYLLKLLYDTDKEKFKDIIFSGETIFLSQDFFYDYIYETILDVLDIVFEHKEYYSYKQNYLDLMIFSDRIVEEFYKLAGEYGELKGLVEENNPYFNEAENEMCRNFNFSYSLDWTLKGYSKPKRQFRSRIALFIDTCEYVDMCGIAIGLLNMYRFFRDKRNELVELLYTKEATVA